MIEIICIRGEGDKEASEINDSLISSEYIAIQRGTHFIDENWYRRKQRDLRVPYKDSVTIGCVVSANESLLNLVGNHVVTDHKIEITRDGMFSYISIEQHEEGE